MCFLAGADDALAFLAGRAVTLAAGLLARLLAAVRRANAPAFRAGIEVLGCYNSDVTVVAPLMQLIESVCNQPVEE